MKRFRGENNVIFHPEAIRKLLRGEKRGIFHPVMSEYHNDAAGEKKNRPEDGLPGK